MYKHMTIYMHPYTQKQIWMEWKNMKEKNKTLFWLLIMGNNLVGKWSILGGLPRMLSLDWVWSLFKDIPKYRN